MCSVQLGSVSAPFKDAVVSAPLGERSALAQRLPLGHSKWPDLFVDLVLHGPVCLSRPRAVVHSRFEVRECESSILVPFS